MHHTSLAVRVEQLEEGKQVALDTELSDAMCRLHGCKEPVYTERNGYRHAYCSRTHASQDGALKDDVEEPALKFEAGKLLKKL